MDRELSHIVPVPEPSGRLGAQVGVPLPYSRLQESEADQIGLVLAARAGCDPHAALGGMAMHGRAFQQASPGVSVDAPRTETRLKDIEARFLPQAMEQLRAHPDPGHRPLPPPEQISGPR